MPASLIARRVAGWVFAISVISAGVRADGQEAIAVSSPHPAAQVEHLSAGPVRMKLADGQLRFIKVGEKEIFRRLYFVARDGNWNTGMPQYSSITLEKGDDHFVVRLAATCKRPTIDYSWTGIITGSPDGKITFEAEGAPNDDFDSNRIGLCLLFGRESLAEQAFETDGKPAAGKFPLLVSPTLVAEQFHNIRYTTPEGLSVSASLSGAIFDMEDQRNWGDSSWKAYAPLSYNYKRVNRGDRKSESITLTVSGAAGAAPAPHDPVHVRIGQPIAGAKVPQFVAPDAGRVPDYSSINFTRGAFANAPRVQWSYTPNTHLPDDDTIMENVPAVADQAKTIHGYNPSARLVVNPLHVSEEKKNQPVTAAWAAAMVQSLALGGVESAGFDLGGELSAAALDAIRPLAGKQLLSVQTTPPRSSHLYAWAVEGETGPIVFLINRTTHAWTAQLEGVTAQKGSVLAVGPGASEQPANIVDGSLSVKVEAYGVCRVTLGK